MTRQRFLKLSLLLLLPAIVWGSYVAVFLLSPVTPNPPAALTVSRGSSLHQVAQQLETAGVISDAWHFRLLGRLLGSAGKIRSGDYAFDQPATPGQVLDRLVAGDVRQLKLTIPEGFDLQQIAARADALLGIGGELLRLAQDPAFVRQLGIPGPTLEGYLYPETYTVTSETTAGQLLRSMKQQLDKQLTPAYQQQAGKLGLTLHQAVTLASIVQKEAGNTGEMPLIAAVFLNRLQRHIPLQADPTVIYGLESFDGNLTRKHLETPTPYNTYVIRGLPPGPIASPGHEALNAVIHPAPSKALYFVARGDGTHVFSESLKEHNRAVKRYQLKHGD